MRGAPSSAVRRLARAAHFLLSLVVAYKLSTAFDFSLYAFTGSPYRLKHDDAVDLVRRNFFRYQIQENIHTSPKPANTKAGNKRRSDPKTETKQTSDPRQILLRNKVATGGIEVLNNVFESELSNGMFRCSLKLSLGDKEDPLAFSGTGFTADQAEQNAAFTAIYHLRSLGVENAAQRAADGIMQLTVRATEAFEKVGNDAHSADVDIRTGDDLRFFFRAVAELQGLGSAHVLLNTKGGIASIRLNRSGREALLADDAILKLRIVNGRDREFWDNLSDSAVQHLQTHTNGTVQLLLDGGMRSENTNDLHRSGIILIKGIQQAITKLDSGAQVYFLPQKLGIENDASMSVLLCLA